VRTENPSDAVQRADHSAFQLGDVVAVGRGQFLREKGLPSFDGTATVAVFTIKVETIADDEDEPDGYGEILIKVETTDYRDSALSARSGAFRLVDVA
jgi:hypothetical protein